MLKVFISEANKYALKLDESDNKVFVNIVDAQTGIRVNCGKLVTITTDGLFRPTVVNKDAARALGIPLDDRGRICLDGEEE